MATQYTAGLTTGQVLTAATMNSIGAAWETWTPTVIQNVNVAVTISTARYTRIQKLVIAQCTVVCTGTGTANNAVRLSLPIAARAADGSGNSYGYIYDNSASTLYTVYGTLATTTSVNFYYTNASGNQWGQAPNIALTTSDQLSIVSIYEAA